MRCARETHFVPFFVPSCLCGSKLCRFVGGKNAAPSADASKDRTDDRTGRRHKGGRRSAFPPYGMRCFRVDSLIRWISELRKEKKTSTE